MSEKDNKSDPKAAGKAQAVSPLADIYTLLGVTEMTTLEGVRTRFFKLTRKIHRQLHAKPDRHTRDQLLGQLRYMCIAHDILTDPVTRTDYDLRTMGLRAEASAAKSPEEKKPAMALGNRSTLRIGELLTVAGLLESTELDIACDMHKAMPEMQFGRFLVKQGFIEEYQLEAVLYAQRLLRKGLITIVQYQAAMEELESSGVPVVETVIERGYASKSDIDQMEAEENAVQEITAPVYVMPNISNKAPEVEEHKPGLLAKIIDAHNAAASTTEAPTASALSKLLKSTMTNMAPAATKDDSTSGTYRLVGELPNKESQPASLDTGEFDAQSIDVETIEESAQQKMRSKAPNPGETQNRMDALKRQSDILEEPLTAPPADEEIEDDCRYDLATGEQIVDLSQRRTYDTIPAVRPDALNVEVKGREDEMSTGDFAVVEEQPAESLQASAEPEPSLIKFSNAAPSWKDQIDWSEPAEEEEEEEKPASVENESVDLTEAVHSEAREREADRQRDTDPELSKTAALETAMQSNDHIPTEEPVRARDETGELSDYIKDRRGVTGDLTDYVKAAEIDFDMDGSEAESARDKRFDTGELDRAQILEKLTRPADDEDENDDDEDEVFSGQPTVPDIISDEDDILDEDEESDLHEEEGEEDDDDAFRVTASYTQSFSFDDEAEEDEHFYRYKNHRADNNGEYQAEGDRLDDASQPV